MFCDGRLVADHERIWARHQTITDPAHLAAAQALRRERLTALRPPGRADVQIRCLADYDAALGLDGGVALMAAKTARPGRWPPRSPS